MVNGKEYDASSDGYAFGVMLLMLLSGHEALGLTERCRNLLRHPKVPDMWAVAGVPDPLAGSWPDTVMVEVAEIAAGLLERYQDERMPMVQACDRLAQVVVAHPPAPPPSAATTNTNATLDARATSSDPTASAPHPKECMRCLEKPRSIRFACGHACLCQGCYTIEWAEKEEAFHRALEVALEAAKALEAEVGTPQPFQGIGCYICSALVGGRPFAEVGGRVAMGATFVRPCGRGGRGVRGGRGGRGRA